MTPASTGPAPTGKNSAPQDGASPHASAIAAANNDVCVNVTLICGGLSNFQTPVAIGPRYDGLPLAGGTKAFDLLLDSWLTRAIDLGMVGSGLGQLFPINLARSYEAGLVKARYLLLAGMGAPGQFAADDLRFVISNVTVATKTLGHDQFTTPLFGTRRKEMTIADAVRGLAEGVLDGYERLRAIAGALTQNRNHLQEALNRPLSLVLIEANRDKLRQIEEAFDGICSPGAIPGLKLTINQGKDVDPDRKCEPTAGDTDPNEPISLLRVTKSKALASGDVDNETELFQFSSLSESAAVPVREEIINSYLIRELPDRMIKPRPPGERQALGTFFASYLIPEDFKSLTEGSGNLIIEVDDTTAKYPWEMAAHKKYARTSFLGMNMRVSRQFRSLLAPTPSSPPALNKKLKALIVADPASGRLALPGARKEGQAVAQMMNEANAAWAGQYDISIKVRIGSPNDPSIRDQLDQLRKNNPAITSAEPCDPFELAMLIMMEQFDIVHYAGHGRFDLKHNRAGWVFAEDCFLTAQEIFRVRQVPRLVFANACFSAAITEDTKERDHLVGLAQAFFARGIPNFIGTGWAVDDDCALEFARWFYARVLGLDGPDGDVIGTSPPATIGDALRTARGKAFDRNPQSSSWGAYQHYGRVGDKLLPFVNVMREPDATEWANAETVAAPPSPMSFAAAANTSPFPVGATKLGDAAMPTAGLATPKPKPVTDSANLVFVNGIDLETGQYAFAPRTIEDMAKLVLMRPRIDTFDDMHAESPRSFGIPFGMDPSRIDQAGWGIVFHEDTPQPIRDALEPLVNARKAQAGELFKILDYKKGEQTRAWYQRHRISAGNIDPEIVPFYLLLVGPPDLIPFEFQYLVGVEYAVGRLALDTAADYERYARSIVAYEKAGAVPNAKEIAYWGTRHPGDPATNLSASLLISPLADGIAGAAGALKRPINAEVGYDRRLNLGDDATKAALLEMMRANKPPAMLFTASHGMSVKSGQPAQRSTQGALLCQDWTGFGGVRPEHFLAAADIPDDANVNGMVAFFFACFGAGTPDGDQFLMDFSQAGNAPPLAPAPFTAALPKRLLAHPNGSALAVLGHVDRAWGCSIQAAKIPDAQIGTFRNSIGFILNGAPVGHAMSMQFGARFAALSTALSSSTSPTAPAAARLSDRDLVMQWLERNDAQNYVLLGDPAVRIRKDDLR